MISLQNRQMTAMESLFISWSEHENIAFRPTERRSSAMCQLLSMNCNNTASIQFSFTGFSERGGHTSDHVDGWGIAFSRATREAGCLSTTSRLMNPLWRG